MSNNVNIILNANGPLTDASGNLITSCKSSLGDSTGCDQQYEFTPMKCYHNPLTWTEIIILIVLKVVFIAVFTMSEDWGWTLVYVGTLAGILYTVYMAAVFDYSYANLLLTSNLYENPWYILWTLILNILFYVAMFLCGISIFEDKKLIVIFAEVCIWVMFFYFIIADAYRFLLHKHLLLDVANALDIGLPPPIQLPPAPTPAPATIPPPPVQEDEVFNIAGNQYSYKEAKAVCQAFGAQLANYEQIEQAYENGAEWVSYGWSEGQYAYFPLQKETWVKMDQNNPDNANGKIRPGISGGYFANPDILFGANCYGKKPKPRDQDLQDILPGTPAHTAKDKALDEKVKYYKKNAHIYAFNENRWYRDPNKKDN